MPDQNYIDRLAEQIRDLTPEELLPEDEPRINDLFRLYALLALAKGEATSARDVHDAWSSWKTLIGDGDHESVVPFSELDQQTRSEDGPFVQAIRNASKPT